jgi:hypothetical protein
MQFKGQTDERDLVLEKLDVISRLEKGGQIVDICHNVRLTVMYVQFMIILLELKKVLSQELK